MLLVIGAWTWDRWREVKARVIMLGPSLDSMGGVASVAATLLGSRLAEDCELRYIGTVSEGSKLHKAAVFARSWLRFSKLVGGCDIVHVHLALGNSFPRKLQFIKLAKRAGKKIVIHMHEGQFDPQLRAMSASKRRLVISTLEDADELIVLSEEWLDYFSNILPNPPRMTVLHNAVEVPSSASRSYAARAVLFLGKHSAGKSPDVLLRALAPLCLKYPDLEAHFGGNGDVAVYEQLASDLGIADRCTFHGWVTGEDRERLFNRCTVYCLPSRNEGMPMSVLEAMAHGLATVSTPVGGIPQIISNGKTGYMTPVGDSKALSETLDGLFGDESLRRRIGEAGHDVVKNRFSIDKQADTLMRVYEEVLTR